MIHKNIKSGLAAILMCFCFSTGMAQQLPQFTQFAINPYLVNPAIAGTEDFIHLQAGYRTQWTGFDDAPQTGYFSGHTTLNNRSLGYNQQKLSTANRVSTGLVLHTDRTGPLKQSSVAATFAYNFALSQNGWRTSFGINAGLKQFSFNPTGYTDNVLDQDDPTIQQMINKNLLNLSAGFWLYGPHFFVGASSFQFFMMDYSARNGAEEILPRSVFLRHYYLMTGFKANLGSDLYLVPSILLKAVEGAPFSYDLNAKFVLADKYWLGGSYRKDDSFAVLGGLLIYDRLELSFSFDLILSRIRYGAASSSEIHLGYRLFHHPKVICPDNFW